MNRLQLIDNLMSDKKKKRTYSPIENSRKKKNPYLRIINLQSDYTIERNFSR